MSNWCIGCGREIPDGDLCSSCQALENYRQSKKQEEEECKDCWYGWVQVSESEVQPCPKCNSNGKKV